MPFKLPVCLQWPLFHLAMAIFISIFILSIFSMAKFIFIFILSILQWPSLSLSLSYISCDGHLFLYLYLIYLAMTISIYLSYSIFCCRPSPCPFNCLGVCNGPQRHRPRKVLLSVPSFTENIFTTP